MSVDLLCVYGNIKTYMEKRKIKPLNEYTENEFRNGIRNRGFVVIGSEKVIIVITSDVSAIPAKQSDFQKLLNNIKLDKKELVLVSHRYISTNIREYANANNINLYSYTYSIFLIDITKAPMVPEHILLTPEEADEFRRTASCDMLNNLPKISILDVQAIWLGARIGDIIKIIRMSESTGYSVYYRVCVG